jgi:hypothetical protein
MRCTLILRDERAAQSSERERLRAIALDALAEDPYLEAVEIIDRRGAGAIFARGGEVRTTPPVGRTTTGAVAMLGAR